MKIHTFDGKQYIALGDFDWLRHNLIRDIRDKYEQGQTPSAEDIGAIGAYSHIMVKVLEDLLHAAHEEATDAESLREGYARIYDRMRWEWASDKWMICATDKTQDSESTIYFVRIDEDDTGKETPIFTDIKRKADFFDDYHVALCVTERLKKLTSGMDKAVSNIRIEPAYVHFTNCAKHLLDAIFGDSNEESDEHEYCVFLEPGDDRDGMWFSGWIKYRDDLPEGMKEWLSKADVKQGESVPIFSTIPTKLMRFKYKGMAEKTAEKIEKMYPEFAGKLHVQIYEEMPDNGPQE